MWARIQVAASGREAERVLVVVTGVGGSKKSSLIHGSASSLDGAYSPGGGHQLRNSEAGSNLVDMGR